MRKSVLTYLFLGFVLVLCSVVGTLWANEEKEELVRYIKVDMVDGETFRWALNEVDSFTQDFDSVHIWQDDSAVFSSARRDVSWVYFEDLMTYWVAYQSSDVTNGVVNPTGGG